MSFFRRIIVAADAGCARCSA